MIIGIDGNEANVKERVGVNTYAFEVLWGLWKLQGESKNQDQLIVYLKSEPLSDLPKQRENFKYKVIPGNNLWIFKKLIPELFFGSYRPDVFFSPNHYAPIISPIPVVSSIMDLGYLKYSGQFSKKDFWQLKLWSAISIYISKAIIAISNSTKEEIVRHYPSSNNKIHVAQLAYDKELFNMDISSKDVRRIKNKYTIVDDYVLYLGTLKPSKNIESLIMAFSKIKTQSKLKLVIAGKKGWMFDSIFDKVKSMGLVDRVIFTGFIPEEDKPALIAGAKVFGLVSYWEGFGLDVLNAMASGVPVVVSNVGSLPEVAENAGIFVDPYSVDSIRLGLESVLFAPKEQYNKIVRMGLAQVKKFDWEKTAKGILGVIQDVKR